MTKTDPQQHDVRPVFIPEARVSQSEELIEEMPGGVWSSYRKFANKNIEAIAMCIYTHGPLDFSTISEITGQPSNILNHNLIEMKKTRLLIYRDGIYYLTQYGALLFESSQKLKANLRELETTEVFKAVYRNGEPK